MKSPMLLLAREIITTMFGDVKQEKSVVWHKELAHLMTEQPCHKDDTSGIVQVAV